MNLLQIPGLTTTVTDSIPTIKEETAMLKSLPFDELVDKLVNTMVTFAINLAIAIVVFYIGRLIINKLYNFVSSIFERRKLDRSLATFILSMVRIVLYFIVIVIVIGILGINTSSFIAIFASAGVAIGMALSGTLQNFAGGVLILLLKPYKIGDFIEAQGYSGTVHEIQIFHTIITTGDNKAIIIPNGGLSTGSINNYSREEYRRVDWTIGISYGNSVENARNCILGILRSDNRVVEKYIDVDREKRAEELKHTMGSDAQSTTTTDNTEKNTSFLRRLFSGKKKIIQNTASPADHKPHPFVAVPLDCSPTVNVSNLGESSVDLTVRAWTRTSDFWGVYFAMNERFYNELPKAGISFPFPQLDVHTYAQK